MFQKLSSNFSIKLHSYITDLDAFGIVYSPNFFGKSQIKSIYGGLLTILLMILGVIKIGQLINRASLKSDFYTISEKKINSDTEIKLKNISLSFCVESVYDEIYEYLAFEPFIDSLLGESSEVEKINTKLGGVLTYSCYRYDLSNLFLEDSENVFLLRTLDTFIIGYEYYLPLRLTLIYDQVFIDDSNYFHPVSYKRNMMETQQINYFNYDLDCVVDEINVKYSNKFSFLFFYHDYEEENTYPTITECKLSPSTAPYKGSLHIKLKLSGWKYKYTFIGYDIRRLVSEFGGYFQVLNLSIGIIASLINKLVLNNRLMSNFKQKISYFRDFKNQTNKNSKNDDELSKTQILGIKLKRLTDDVSKNEIKREVSPRNKYKLNILSNIIKIDEEPSKEYSYKRNSINSMGNGNKMNKLLQDNILFFLDILKKNELNGSFYLKSKKKNYEEIKQFKYVFDCHSIYQLYKDVKLLEFLCLNTENSEAYYKFRKVPLNIQKLEKCINRIIIENEEKEYFENLEEKIKIIFNCIIKF